MDKQTHEMSSLDAVAESYAAMRAGKPKLGSACAKVACAYDSLADAHHKLGAFLRAVARDEPTTQYASEAAALASLAAEFAQAAADLTV